MAFQSDDEMGGEGLSPLKPHIMAVQRPLTQFLGATSAQTAIFW
jgi:hypothetical protein